MFPTIDLLTSEYQEGWLDAAGLEQYIGLGCLTRDQFNQITGNTQTTSSAANNNSGKATQNSSSSFNPVA